MVRLIRWLLGYVEIEFVGGFSQDFLSEAYRLGANIFDIEAKGDKLLAKCRLGSYKTLCRLAKKHGGRVHIVKRHGIIFSILYLRTRMGLVVGAFAFVIVFCLLQGFVWQIDIVGNDRVTDTQIAYLLSQNGFSKGAYWKNTDKDYLESLLLATFPDIAWAHINQYGSVAKVEVRETVEKPTISDQEGIYNVLSTKDGIIVSVTAYEGWETVQKGDSVVEGDLLISGIHKTDETTNSAFAHAKGEIIAQVEEDFELNVSRLQKRKSYTSIKSYKEIYLFGITIPLHFPLGNSLDMDIKTSEKFVRLNKKDLPLGVITKKVYRFEIEERELSDSELTSLTNSKIENALALKYADSEIIKKDLSVALNSENATVNGKVTILEDIGEEQAVKKK